MAIMRNDKGDTRRFEIGFSWTTFFFGFFVPLFRRDLKWFTIQVFSLIVFQIIVESLIIFFNPDMVNSLPGNKFFYPDLPKLFFAFYYNKLYIKDLLKKGYLPYDVDSVIELKKIGMYPCGENKFEQGVSS